MALLKAPKIQCLHCNAIIQSKHRHDFVLCDCVYGSGTSIFVDGGTSYFRMGAEKNASWIELPEDTDSSNT